MIDVGRRIRALREACGWSQVELAAKLGRTQTAISYWENGEREPGLADLVALAAAFTVHPGALLGSEDGPEPGLTIAEHKALELTAQLWNQLAGQVIKDGPSGDLDRQELAAHIHAIQRAVMAQAAARAYPGLFRLLGDWPVGDGRDLRRGRE